MDKDFIKRAVEKINGKNKTVILAVLCVIGVAMILLSNTEKNKPAAPREALTLSDEAYNEAYINALKEDLSEIISLIDGVGRVNVAITLEAGVSYEYASEKSYLDDSEESGGSYRKSGESTLIVLDGENGEAPVLLRRNEPVVLGVAVVCEGGDNPLIKEKIIETASVLCGIKSNRVSVSKMS